jgi:DNA-binding LacI/PurR family transcriptional regulator
MEVAWERQSDSKLGRPSARKNSLVRQLRHKIIAGELAPGTQLPSRLEIVERFGASPVTVQKALDRLVEDGFVRVQGRQGTFVSEHPPHLSRYAVVFSAQPYESHRWRRFWTALTNEAMSLAKAKGRELPICHGIWPRADNEEFQKLSADVQAHRVAGLIFTVDPNLYRHTPLVEEPGVPRVAIVGEAVPGVLAVRLDAHSFIDRALDYLVARGHQKVAMICHDGFLLHEEYFHEAMKKRGLETKPYWLQICHLEVPAAASHSVQLLMHSRKTESFDALIIADDNLVEHATSGLLATGVRIPQEVEIVAHSNFPLLSPAALPSARLGYDAHEVMNTCINLIDQARAGEEAPAVTSIPARFENEVASREEGI